jgi:hypothetical protein
MEVNKFFKSSKNLPVEGNISNNQNIHIRNNFSRNENIDDKNILFNFLSSKKKITLKSYFDYKGAKKFLSEKEKAMASLELYDDIIEEKNIKKRRNRKSMLKSKNKRNTKSESQRILINVKIRKPKYNNENKKDQRKKKKMSDQTVALYCAINCQKERKLTMNCDFSIIKRKGPLNLAYNQNDSFIHSILKEMAQVEH